MQTVTPRQKQVLRFVYESLRTEGFPPNFSELKERLKISSNQSLIDLLKGLEAKKYIKREEGARAIKILKKGFQELRVPPLVPFVGTSSAGYFLETSEMVGEWQPLSQDLARFGDEVFLVRVTGDSMINAGIYDGDIIVVRKSQDIKPKDIVLAREGGETTIKRFVYKRGKPFLQPESSNPTYQAIPISLEGDVEFLGKVIAVFNSLDQKPRLLERERQVAEDTVLVNPDSVVSFVKQDTLKNPYFRDDNFLLYHGDSLELLQQFPENSVDMVFADPPYNLSNGGFTVHAGKRVSVNKGVWDVSRGVEEDFVFHKKWIEACKRVLKPQGTIWISGTYHSIYQCGYALQQAGYHILNDITWYKPNASPNLSGRYFTASHETLLWARKEKKAKHYFNYKFAKEGNWKEDFLKKPGKQMRSVWAMNTPQNGEKKFGKHPTQKPLDLLRRIVLTSTREGDLVLDPFTGSSTTGLAAVESRRKFIGIDLEEAYLELSKQRFQDMFKQKVLT